MVKYIHNHSDQKEFNSQVVKIMQKMHHAQEKPSFKA